MRIAVEKAERFKGAFRRARRDVGALQRQRAPMLLFGYSLPGACEPRRDAAARRQASTAQGLPGATVFYNAAPQGMRHMREFRHGLPTTPGQERWSANAEQPDCGKGLACRKGIKRIWPPRRFAHAGRAHSGRSGSLRLQPSRMSCERRSCLFPGRH